jgi:hypothetical protein
MATGTGPLGSSRKRLTDFSGPPIPPQFRLILPVLTESHSVVTYDVYGCGESPKPVDSEAYATEVSRQVVAPFGSGGDPPSCSSFWQRSLL